ncbi:hypothetical protein JCM5353_003616 [Sporobolomyces roseus]
MTTDLAPGIPLVPVPWDVQGQGWIYPIYTPFSTTPIPQSLSKAAYSDFERGSQFDMTERYHGGVGMVMIIRYEQGPAGPYDELLYIPGLFSKEDKPEQYFLTTTRIYVSTDVSVANGRREWGIPKHRANFTFTPLPRSSKIHLTVSHPTSLTPQPFFSAVLSESKLTPCPLPVSTSWLSWSLSKWLMDVYTPTLIQPPLSSAQDEPEKAEFTLKQTNQTISAFTGSQGKPLAFTPSSTGWSKLSYLEVKAPEGGTEEEDWQGFGDGKGFPRFVVAKEGIISGKGVRLTSFKMHIPAGIVVE